MQTKNYHSQDLPHLWKNLTHCSRNVFRNEFSIQCEIDENPIRLKYHMRLIKVNSEKRSYEVLVQPTDEGHDQDGLFCFHDHGIQNLRSINVTSTSMLISWSFYPWDIHLIMYMDIKVKNQKNEKVTHLTVNTGSHLSVNQQHLITGLKMCEAYTVEVHYKYTLEESRTELLRVDTMCPHNVSFKFNVSIGELVIIILCSLLLMLAIVFLVHFLRQTRQRELRGQSNTFVVIDMKELMMYDKH